MKANFFSNNLISNKVAENNINKFSRSEFLSSSNQFKNLIKKSEEKNNEEKEKYEKKDLHLEKLNDKIAKSKSPEQDDLFAMLSAQGEVKPVDLFQLDKSEMTVEQANMLDKRLQSLGVKEDLKQILSSVDKLSSVANNTEIEDLGKFKLTDDFKKVDDLKLDQKIKLQDDLKNVDLKNIGKLEHQKEAAKSAKLGLNSLDAKFKNEFNIQNSLRSKSLDVKNKIGQIKAAKAYEQAQPNIATKSGPKLTEGTKEVAAVNGKRVKPVKNLNLTKTNSDTLKNDLLNNNLEFEAKIEKNQDVGKNEFSKLMNLQNQFKAEGTEDIIKQAQFLANKGGGEMKLLLNPRGLGELKLKVLMEENQIKVEMLTDNSDAKEVIEATLNDLRKALGDNQIQVDEITVDSYERLTDLITDTEKEASQEFARDFLSEFRQQNNEFRQGLIDFPVVKRRRSQIIEDGTVNVKQKDPNRKLDLVA